MSQLTFIKVDVIHSIGGVSVPRYVDRLYELSDGPLIHQVCEGGCIEMNCLEV